jgi:hypothetical protein
VNTWLSTQNGIKITPDGSQRVIILSRAMAAVRGRVLSTTTKRAFDKMATARKITVDRRFDGMPKESDFKVVEEQLPPLKDGGECGPDAFDVFLPEFLAEAVYLSVDPYMRAYAHNIPLGATMVGTQVAR